MTPGSGGNWLIVAGIALIAAGLIAKTGALGWFGHLPGDIHVRRENAQFYFPVTSMIVVSVVLSLVLAVIRRLF